MKGKSRWLKTAVWFIAAAGLMAAGLWVLRTSNRGGPGKETSRKVSGQIYLYGEDHTDLTGMERELELWGEYYTDGLRHLFMEMPYYDAECLNDWMRSDGDGILLGMFGLEESEDGYPEQVEFYRNIKENCPGTVFHGTDVGHRYDTAGERFLARLREQGQENSERYRLTREAIEQGKTFSRGGEQDHVYRENTMVENFIREFDCLDGESVMGIYGSAHTWIDAMDFSTQTVPFMANQLHARYGDILHTTDLADLKEPYYTETVRIGEKEYTASFFGKRDLSDRFPEYRTREFWRLEDAYGDFKSCPRTGDILPYDNYPMDIEEGQVFLIVYTKTDGSVERRFYRSDGAEWMGMPVTEECNHVED